MIKPKFYVGQILEHLKTRDTYMVLNTPDNVRIEATNAPSYIYMHIPTMQIWVRPQDEMEDGRFVWLK